MPAVPQSTAGLTWFKSSYSGANATECVEAALVHSEVLIRDSKHAGGRHIAVSAAAWGRFVTDARLIRR
ncbi:protein of unknown function DUF397 [Actinobacteria bacterium OK074]|nr:protein of unknown function DUF397 [Actinobacteria bacterium OK074]